MLHLAVPSHSTASSSDSVTIVNNGNGNWRVTDLHIFASLIR